MLLVRHKVHRGVCAGASSAVKVAAVCRSCDRSTQKYLCMCADVGFAIEIARFVLQPSPVCTTVFKHTHAQRTRRTPCGCCPHCDSKHEQQRQARMSKNIMNINSIAMRYSSIQLIVFEEILLVSGVHIAIIAQAKVDIMQYSK